MGTYLTLLRRPGAARPFASALLGRLTPGMVALAIVLLVRAEPVRKRHTSETVGCDGFRHSRRGPGCVRPLVASVQRANASGGE